MTTTTVVKGVVKAQGIPDAACFTTFADLLSQLGQYLTVELPQDAISNVVISVEQPGDDARNKLWVRRATNGAIIGLFTYAGGVWNALSPAPNQVFWFYGDSRAVPTGYKLIDANNPILPSSQIAEIVALYKKEPTVSYFFYYAATFVGVAPT